MAKGNWFAARSSWAEPIVGEIVKETDQRVYYGELRKTWRNKEGQPRYVEKAACFVCHVDEDTVHKAVAIWQLASTKRDEARAHYTKVCAEINQKRDADICALVLS